MENNNNNIRTGPPWVGYLLVFVIYKASSGIENFGTFETITCPFERELELEEVTKSEA